MPSPFPGMDPLIEGEGWPGFHTQYIAQIQRDLAPRVRPRYATFIEEYVYLRREPNGANGRLRPDTLVVERLRGRSRTASRPGISSGANVLDPPLLLPLPWEETETQVYLEVRRRETGRVVCVIELLSPINKQAVTGQDEYLVKRNT